MPERTLSEMVRVTRSDGRIVVADTDHSTMTIDTSDIDIEWKLRCFRTEIFKNSDDILQAESSISLSSSFFWQIIILLIFSQA
jgi:hypothetical protein